MKGPGSETERDLRKDEEGEGEGEGEGKDEGEGEADMLALERPTTHVDPGASVESHSYPRPSRRHRNTASGTTPITHQAHEHHQHARVTSCQTWVAAAGAYGPVVLCLL